MPLEQHDGYQNGQAFAEDVMKALQATPLDLTNPVPLSFFLYLPDEPTARRIGESLVTEGYEVDVDESASDDGRWLCWCDLSLIPTIELLMPIGDRFLSLAKDNKGEFDGWETNPYKIQGGLQDVMKQMAEKLGLENEH
jgi:hypothetical protein